MNDKTIYLCDAISAISARITDEGFIKGEAVFTRSGVFPYRGADGKMFNIYRPKEEVFSDSHLKSTQLIPFVNDHPASKRVDINNAKNSTIGVTGETTKIVNDNLLVGSFLITDSKAVKHIADGEKVELSMGYQALICDEEGEFEGIKYDKVQRDLKANHLALVDRGRANVNFSGEQSRINLLDSFDYIMDNENNFSLNLDKKGDRMIKVMIDNIEYDAAPEVKNALSKEKSGNAILTQKITDSQIAYDSIKADLEKIKGERDVLNDEVKQLKDSATDHTKLDELVKERAAILDNAEKVLEKKEFSDASAKSNIEIKKAVVMKMRPKIVLDEKDDIYIDGCYETVVDLMPKEKEGGNEKNNMADDDDGNGYKNINDARDAMIKRNREAWKKNTEGGK